MDDTTKTGEAWRDEFCQVCRAAWRHERGADGAWHCTHCGTQADPHTARRLDGAESNQRKQDGVTVSN